MKFCSRCKTENSDDYKFCKQCGMPLDNQYSAGYHNPNGYQYTGPIVDDFDGIPADETTAFVGKNSHKILPKFTKMQITNSKISWCWPAAILGFFFGFFGLAIWLLYRKMRKHALICAAIGTVLCIIQTVITYGSNVELLEAFRHTISQSINNPANIEGIINQFENFFNQYKSLPMVNISSFIAELEAYIAAILGGIFGLHYYKTFALDKIIRYKANANLGEHYMYGLGLLGGTSSGGAVLAVLVMMAIESAVETIPLIVVSL